jgi:hypothetical protein
MPPRQGHQGKATKAAAEAGHRRGSRKEVPPQSLSAVEACHRKGCRGENPRTPPAAGEVAHVLGLSAHMLGCTCRLPPP